MNYDVVIAGGGPAGLSAALILGRGRKSVLLCDAGTPRNAAAKGVHGFVTRDGVPPGELRRAAKADLAAYPNVAIRDTGVVDVAREGARLTIALADGAVVSARRVLIASGVVDDVPDLPGLRELWGKSVFQCPYCHGWEARDRPWGILATDAHAEEFSLLVTGWTRDVVLFTQGLALSATGLERIRGAGVRVEERRVVRLAGTEQLEAVVLEDGTAVPRGVLFFRPPQRLAPLAERLGLARNQEGYVATDMHKETSMQGVHAAGDVTTMRQGALIAAAEGALAAYGMNHLLTVEAAVAAA